LNNTYYIQTIPFKLLAVPQTLPFVLSRLPKP